MTRTARLIANVCRSKPQGFSQRRSWPPARRVTGWSAAPARTCAGRSFTGSAKFSKAASSSSCTNSSCMREARDATACETRGRCAASIGSIYFAGWADKYQQVFSERQSGGIVAFQFFGARAYRRRCRTRSGGWWSVRARVAISCAGDRRWQYRASCWPPSRAPLSRQLGFAEVLRCVGRAGRRRQPADRISARRIARVTLPRHMDVNAIVYCDGGRSVTNSAHRSSWQAADNRQTRRRSHAAASTGRRSAEPESPYLIRRYPGS